MKIRWSIPALAVFVPLFAPPALAQCEDNNSCTSDALVEGVCVHTPVPDGQFCIERWSLCTQNPFCQAGVCQTGPPNTCDDGNPCTSDSCGTSCRHIPIFDAPCEDGNLCTVNDHCVNGFCTTGNFKFCFTENPCTGSQCDPADGACHESPRSSDYGCDDSDACTVGDHCDGAGACLSGTGTLACGDGNLCTDDGCQSPEGCAYADNGICGNDPESLRYWKRLCQQGPAGGDFLTDVDVACVRQSCTFATVFTLGGLCGELLQDSPSDKCQQAEAQLMALLLNTCRGRTPEDLAIRSRCGNNGTVGQSLAEADSLLCSATRTRKSCDQAACLAEEINSGRAP